MKQNNLRVLMMVNWPVLISGHTPKNLYPANYFVKGHSYHYLKYWSQKIDVEVVGTGTHFFTQKIEKNYIKFYILQTFKILSKLNQYDLIISHGAQSGIVLALIKTVFRIKKPKHVVFDIGGFKSASTNKYINKIIEYSTKSIDKVIVHSKSLITYYQEYLPSLVNKSNFIKLGIDIEYFSSFVQNDIKEHPKKTIICVGHSKRDWDTLITAFEQLDLKNVELKLIGNNQLKTNHPHIKLLPYIPFHELINEIKKSTFVIIPLESYKYSYGQLSVLQPMALGKSVITSNVPSMTDYLEDGKTALLYEPKNVNDLKLKIMTLINNPELRKAIGENAKKEIIDNLNLKKMQLEVEKVISLIM